MKRLLESINKRWSERVFARRIARARNAPDAATIARLAIRLMAGGRLDEAESLLRVGLAHAPDSPDLLEQFAFCAHNTGRYREALDRWRRLSALRPDLPMSWCGISANARELGILDEAAAAADEALRRFPDDAVVLTEAARVREYCGAFAEAAELWRGLLSHPSADESWHLAVARNLIAQERYDEAQAILVALQAPEDLGSAKTRLKMARQWCEMAEVVTHPDRVRFARHAAEAVPRFGEAAYGVPHIAETTDDLPAAREALQSLVERVPDDIEAHESYVSVLLRAELLEDAERQVRAALRLAPEHEMLTFLQGAIAIRRQDWEAALASATARAAKDPDDLAMLDRMRRVRQLEEAERTRNPARLVPIAPALVEDPEIRQLMLRFESFGQDCEFGTVQRRYGAEPLGLLRWTETGVASLMGALTARFEGIGDPENTELILGLVREIQVRDKRWNLAMHTFLYESEVSLEVLHPKMCRRTAYLRDKLLDELRVGEKTVVFKSDAPDIGDLLALHDALLAYGPNRLLNVRHAGDAQRVPAAEPGSVTEIRPGLFIGHLSRMNDLTDLAYDDWVAVCRGVERLRAENASPAMASAA